MQPVPTPCHGPAVPISWASRPAAPASLRTAAAAANDRLPALVAFTAVPFGPLAEQTAMAVDTGASSSIAAPPASATTPPFDSYLACLDLPHTAELPAEELTLARSCFDAGADYIEPDKAEVAGRGAKKGSVKSKAASKARHARLQAIGKRIAAAHAGRPGQAWLAWAAAAAEDAATSPPAPRAGSPAAFADPPPSAGGRALSTPPPSAKRQRTGAPEAGGAGASSAASSEPIFTPGSRGDPEWWCEAMNAAYPNGRRFDAWCREEEGLSEEERAVWPLRWMWDDDGLAHPHRCTCAQPQCPRPWHE